MESKSNLKMDGKAITTQFLKFDGTYFNPPIDKSNHSPEKQVMIK